MPIFVTDLALKWFPLHKFISSIRSSLRYAALIFSLIIWRRVPTPQKALLSLPWFSLCIFKCVLNLWVPEYLPVPVLFSLAPIVFAHGQDSISLCLVPAPPFRHLSLGRVGSQLFRLFWYLSLSGCSSSSSSSSGLIISNQNLGYFGIYHSGSCTVPLFPLFLTHLLEHIVVLPNSSTSGGNAECIVVR